MATTYTSGPTVHSVTRTGVSPTGFTRYTCMVEYPGEPVYTVHFHGYPGQSDTVVMETTHGQTFVSDPGRFGTFGVSWVRRFFGGE